MPDDLETPDEESETESSVITQLRRDAKAKSEWEAKAIQLERDNVVLRAGLSELSEKQLKALSAAHEGDWDVEAIRATANELGFGKRTEQSEEPRISSDEEAAMRGARDATSGERQPPDPDINAIINGEYASLEEYDAALKNANVLTNVNDL